MDPKLQEQLVAYLKAIADTAKAGANFAIEQAPLVVQEKIAYGRAYETAWIAIFVIALVIGARLLRTAFELVPAFNEASYQEEPVVGIRMFPRFVIGGGLALWGFIGTLANLGTVLQVWCAPRLYILDWVMGLLSKK